ncbi:hypothetical protein GCM10020229_62930 [Kitasatospora albolonga]
MISPEYALEALRRHGVVEWGRLSVGVDPLDGLVRPPLIAWRYASPTVSIATLIGDAVGSADTVYEWTVSLGGRTWYIVPERIDRVMRSAGPGNPDALGCFKMQNQDFCAATMNELALILRRI